MSLSPIEESVLVAAYYRGGDDPDTQVWGSNSDQVLTLSLFYTGDIAADDCIERFSRRSYVGSLYDEDGELTELIASRYRVLLSLLQTHPELIEGEGDLKLPADPTYTSCRLTWLGRTFACDLIPSFPMKPHFHNWPDNR